MSYHLTNNRDLFIKELQPISFNFIITGKQTLRIESIRTIVIPLAKSSIIKLERVINTSDCNSNLISLSHLYEYYICK